MKLRPFLSEKLQHTSSNVRRDGTRELQILGKIRYAYFQYFKVNKHNHKKQVNCIFLKPGEMLTSYNELAQLWGCNRNQARYQIQKWCNIGLIKKRVVQDIRKKDLGFIIDYLPFKQFREKKSNTPKHIGLSGRKSVISEKVTPHNREVLSKDKNKQRVVYSFHTNREFTFIADQLRELGFNYNRIQQIYDSFDLQTIIDHLELLNLQRTKKEIQSPIAWLTASLKQKFDLSKVFELRKQKEQEQTNISERLEREAQVELDRKAQANEDRIRLQKDTRICQQWSEQNPEELLYLVEDTKQMSMFRKRDSINWINPESSIDKAFIGLLHSKILAVYNQN